VNLAGSAGSAGAGRQIFIDVFECVATQLEASFNMSNTMQLNIRGLGWWLPTGLTHVWFFTKKKKGRTNKNVDSRRFARIPTDSKWRILTVSLLTVDGGQVGQTDTSRSRICPFQVGGESSGAHVDSKDERKT
jgi:hypothetical protein